jgi:hypothetical protein
MTEMSPEFRHGNNFDFKFIAELNIVVVFIEWALKVSVTEVRYG